MRGWVLSGDDDFVGEHRRVSRVQRRLQLFEDPDAVVVAPVVQDGMVVVGECTLDLRCEKVVRNGLEHATCVRHARMISARSCKNESTRKGRVLRLELFQVVSQAPAHIHEKNVTGVGVILLIKASRHGHRIRSPNQPRRVF
jgi:hypothetical protein